MRRHIVCTVLVLTAAALLTGCGQKGPLTLPPKPNVAAPATRVAPPAQPAATTTAPAANLPSASG